MNQFGRNWDIVTPGAHTRLPNGILGLLCKLHWPGFVEVSGAERLATTFDHYALMADQEDRERRVFQNKAQRVVGEFWVSLPRNILHSSIHHINWTFLNTQLHLHMQDFFRCQEGYQQLANEVAMTACRKLVKDMMYESRISQNIFYKAKYEGVKLNKAACRNLLLTKEQYLMVSIEHG